VNESCEFHYRVGKKPIKKEFGPHSLNHQWSSYTSPWVMELLVISKESILLVLFFNLPVNE
jgi:hypothetical protein